MLVENDKNPVLDDARFRRNHNFLHLIFILVLVQSLRTRKMTSIEKSGFTY